ncbi:MAG: hypothetical protein JO111_11995 [Caulobacteraceae bacterium]|nr:hypothetical protein [Caulobacteraceae bacterium]
MKALLVTFSIAIASLTAWGSGAAQAATPGDCSAAPAAGGYPSFCSIPQPPTGVRTAAEFKTAVLDARGAGRSLTRATARMNWSLSPGQAAPFAAQARAEATPPPPMTPPGEAEDFARRAREEATPPPRPH